MYRLCECLPEALVVAGMDEAVAIAMVERAFGLSFTDEENEEKDYHSAA